MSFSQYDFSKIPFDKITKFGQRSLLNRDLFSVSWILGRYCNYSCSYCWPYAHSSSSDHRPLKLITSTIDEIKLQARQNGFNSFHFSFSGGEPTLHPEYFKILNHYAQDVDNTNYQSLHMTTNLSKSILWFEKYAHATKGLSRVSVTASFHVEHANKKHFKNKLIYLQTKDIQATVNMVMSLENFDPLWEYALELHEAGINVTLKPQSNASATKVIEGYTNEQLSILKEGLPQKNYTSIRLKSLGLKSERKNNFKNSYAKMNEPQMQIELEDESGGKWYLDQAERFNAFNFNNFKGWSCNAGYQSLIIREPDGAIKRSYSCTDEPLGYLDKTFDIFKNPQKCISQSCVSSADSKIPKSKNYY